MGKHSATAFNNSLVMKIFSFSFKAPSLHQVLEMTLRLIKFNRVSRAIFEFTVKNAKRILIRTKHIKLHIELKTEREFCVFTDVARGTMSSILSSLLTPSLMLLMISLFGTNGIVEVVKKEMWSFDSNVFLAKKQRIFHAFQRPLDYS